jgi:cyanate permease
MTHLFRPYIYLAILVLTRTAMGFQFQSVASLSPFLIDELEITFAALGTLIGLFMLPGIFIAIPSGIMGRRLSDKTFAIIGLVGMVAGGAILGAASGFGEAVAGRLVSGTGAVILNVVLAKMVADWFDARDQIVAMAFLVTSWPLGIGLALVVEPMIAEAASWQMAMFAAAVLCAAALVMLWLFCRDPPADEDAKAAAASSLTRREFYLVSLVGLIWTLYNAGYIFAVSFTPGYLADSGASPTAAGIVTSLATWTLIVTVPLGGYLASRIGSDRTWMFWSLAVYFGHCRGPGHRHCRRASSGRHHGRRRFRLAAAKQGHRHGRLFHLVLCGHDRLAVRRRPGPRCHRRSGGDIYIWRCLHGFDGGNPAGFQLCRAPPNTIRGLKKKRGADCAAPQFSVNRNLTIFLCNRSRRNRRDGIRRCSFCYA